MINNTNIGEVLKILKDEYKKNRKPIVTEISLRKRNPFHILIATVLSLRTKDVVTREAAHRLFSIADNPQKISEIPAEKIEKLIYPVGFYHKKAKNIKTISEQILTKYKGNIPNKLNELLKLPGVGRKTANLVIVLAYDKFGICVDTHVHRISNRWGYVKTNTPDKTEFTLRGKLPKKYWKTYNDYLVSFGQHTCKPLNPNCSLCKIDNFCPKIGVRPDK